MAEGPAHARIKRDGLVRGAVETPRMRARSGFSTSLLQSEMILPHMLVQPDSYSLRHMFMHLFKSQLASTPWAEVTATKTVAAKTK